MRPEPVQRPPEIVFAIDVSNGHYHSELRVPISEVHDGIRDQVAEWLAMQIRYLGAMRPGDSVNVRSKLTVGEPG